MSKNILAEMLDREIRGAKTPSVEDVVAMLTGKDDKRSIAKSTPKYTKEERATKIAEMKAKRDGIDAGGSEEPEHIDHIPEIPDGFPEGTILNDDQSLTLPDGRTIRKIEQEVDHEEVS